MPKRVLFVVKELEGAEPLGPLYVAGCLMQAGHECAFIGTRGNDVVAAVKRWPIPACDRPMGPRFHRVVPRGRGC